MSDGLRYEMVPNSHIQRNYSHFIRPLSYRLRQSWYNGLSEAESHFRQLISSSASRDWKRVSTTVDVSSTSKGKARASGSPEVTDVVVHRKAGKSGDQIYRAILDVPIGDDPASLESWKAVLSTPELREVWDPAVEAAHLVEMFDPITRVSKTNFTLGWPVKCVFHPYIIVIASEKRAVREMLLLSHVYSTTHLPS